MIHFENYKMQLTAKIIRQSKLEAKAEKLLKTMH